MGICVMGFDALPDYDALGDRPLRPALGPGLMMIENVVYARSDFLESSVTIPKGSLSYLSLNVDVGLPPDAVYDIVTDPDNKRVFKNIKVNAIEKLVLDIPSGSNIEKGISRRRIKAGCRGGASSDLEVSLVVGNNFGSCFSRPKQRKSYRKDRIMMCEVALCVLVLDGCIPSVSDEVQTVEVGIHGKIRRKLENGASIRGRRVMPSIETEVRERVRGLQQRKRENRVEVEARATDSTSHSSSTSHFMVSQRNHYKDYCRIRLASSTTADSEEKSSETEEGYFCNIKERWALRRKAARHSRRMESHNSKFS
ncbi:hypothetical protein OROMI_007341 [Orobanche minor]